MDTLVCALIHYFYWTETPMDKTSVIFFPDLIEIKQTVRSLSWITYRRDFPPIGTLFCNFDWIFVSRRHGTRFRSWLGLHAQMRSNGYGEGDENCTLSWSRSVNQSKSFNQLITQTSPPTLNSSVKFWVNSATTKTRSILCTILPRWAKTTDCLSAIGIRRIILRRWAGGWCSGECLWVRGIGQGFETGGGFITWHCCSVFSNKILRHR